MAGPPLAATGNKTRNVMRGLMEVSCCRAQRAKLSGGPGASKRRAQEGLQRRGCPVERAGQAREAQKTETSAPVRWNAWLDVPLNNTGRDKKDQSDH